MNDSAAEFHDVSLRRRDVVALENVSLKLRSGQTTEIIGAGGLGDPIVTGLALNDGAQILQGAIPAALLAILTELFFSDLERALVVPHLRSNDLQA